MPGQITRTKQLAAALAALSLLSAAPAAAQDTDRLASQAADAFNAGVDASHAGQFSVACRQYGNAAVLFENTIMSLMGQSMATEEERDYLKSYADRLQAHADQAKEEAKYACSRGDTFPASSVQSPSSQSYDDTNSQQEDLQTLANTAKRQYQEASRLYEARDFAGACSSSRQAADSFGRVAAALKSNGSLEAAFANPAQIYANAAQAQADRDEFFCKA